MGERPRNRADRIENAARSVAADLEEVLTCLEKVQDKVGKRLSKKHQDQLRRSIERVDACQRLLTSELDHSGALDHRFVRAAIKVGAVAASIAMGFVGGELSQDYDLQSPIAAGQDAAGHAQGLDEDLDAEDLDEGRAPRWSLAATAGTWDRWLGDLRQPVAVSRRRLDPGSDIDVATPVVRLEFTNPSGSSERVAVVARASDVPESLSEAVTLALDYLADQASPNYAEAIRRRALQAMTVVDVPPSE